MDERMNTQKTIPEVDENEQYKMNLEDFNNYSKIQLKKWKSQTTSNECSMNVRAQSLSFLCQLGSKLRS